MHIGYLKQGGSLGLDFYGKGTSAGGMWERYVILQGAPSVGHRVTIYSPILKRDLHLLENYDVSYKPDSPCIHPSVDVLYIENGPDNYTFTGPGSPLPLIPRMHRLIKGYKGLIIYDYPDVLLKPALIPEAYSPGTYKYLDVATAVELFENKGWLITSKSHDHRLAGEQGTNSRSPISILGLPTEFLNLACFLEEFWRRPAREWDLDLMYSGNERPRKVFLLKWYGNMPDDITAGIYGKWKNFEELEKANIVYFGPVSMGTLWEKFQTCLAQVYITDSRFLQTMALTDRAYEIIQGGCIMLVPESLHELFEVRKNWESLVKDDAFLISSRAELIKKIRLLQKMTWDERITLNEDQVECIHVNTPTTRIAEFVALVEDYMDLPLSQPEEVIPRVIQHVSESVLGMQESDSKRTSESKEIRRNMLAGRYDFKSGKLTKPFGEIELNIPKQVRIKLRT